MEKLDRLGWAEALSIVAHGARIGVRISRQGVLDELKRRLPPGWKPARGAVVDRMMSVIVGGEERAGVRRFHLLYADAVRLARTHDLAELLETVRTVLEGYVAETSPTRVFLRAGAVGWCGEAVLVLGPSGSGRRRLVDALVASGATLYSREYAVLDPRGRVHPFEAEDAERLRPLPVRLVVLARYRPGERWQPKPLSAGRAMLTLLAYAAPAPRSWFCSSTGFGTLGYALPVVQGARGESEAAARALLGRPTWAAGGAAPASA